MVHKACAVHPADVCLVPERRAELTTEGGLDAAGQLHALAGVVDRLRGAGIRVSLFIDPDARQIDAAQHLHTEAIEIHTGAYADAGTTAAREHELHRIREAAQRAQAAGLIVNAGHGLTLDNVAAIAALPATHELNIGHSIVADALFVGLEEAVRRMKARMLAAVAA
jgi:pyridoxine 5-phosphate synthase